MKLPDTVNNGNISNDNYNHNHLKMKEVKGGKNG